MTVFGISHSVVLNSVWSVVEVINSFEEFYIEFPACHQKQTEIAAVFKDASSVDFNNCVGAIDGILIWIHKPTEIDADKAGIGRSKFFVAESTKLDLTARLLQAVKENS